MSIVRNITFDQAGIARINALAKAFVAAAHGQQKVEAETALLIAYCMIADAVGEYPERTRERRAQIVVNRAARAICDILVDVGKMTDLDVVSMGRTCQE